MKRKTAILENPQQGLFDLDRPNVVVTPVQRAQLTMLVEMLLVEIAVVLATGEEGDEQDHR
jgi:hypothetical protein